MRRGFKTEAERLAARTRNQMGLRPDAGLPIRDLAAHLQVRIYSADRLVARKELEDLDELQPGAFSAATFQLPNGRTVIAFNPLSDQVRTNSDVAHELAHLLLNHDVREIQQIAGQTFFTCDPQQEDEANWLAGCLLLPRPLLVKEAFNGATPEVLSNKYEVSLPMARWRLNASGVLLQVRRARPTLDKR